MSKIEEYIEALQAKDKISDEIIVNLERQIELLEEILVEHKIAMKSVRELVRELDEHLEHYEHDGLSKRLIVEAIDRLDDKII